MESWSTVVNISQLRSVFVIFKTLLLEKNVEKSKKFYERL